MFFIRDMKFYLISMAKLSTTNIFLPSFGTPFDIAVTALFFYSIIIIIIIRWISN